VPTAIQSMNIVGIQTSVQSPCPSLSVLRRSRRLDHEQPPFTENVGVRTRPELCRRRAPVVGYHTTILVGLPDFQLPVCRPYV
jgi:hypothetical protein